MLHRTFVRGTTQSSLEARLREIRDVADPAGIRKILVREPAILGTSVQSMQDNKGQLRKVLSKETEVRAYVVKFPRILRYNWHVKVVPTLEYFERKCNLHKRDVLWSGVCAYSLENAIKPRIEFLLSRNLQVLANNKLKPTGSMGLRSQTVCLTSVIVASHKDFKKRFAPLGYVDHKETAPVGKKATRPDAKKKAVVPEEDEGGASEYDAGGPDWEEAHEGGAYNGDSMTP